MATKNGWTDGDWQVRRHGRSTYHCFNHKVGLTMSVETKAATIKKLEEVKAALEKDPNAVPPGCRKTQERTNAEWQARPYREKLESVNTTVTRLLQGYLEQATDSENKLLEAETIDQLFYDMSDIYVIDCLCRPYYDRLMEVSIEDRPVHLRAEVEKLRKHVESGYRPTTTSPMATAMQHLQHLTYVKMYDSFKSILSLYDEIDKPTSK